MFVHELAFEAPRELIERPRAGGPARAVIVGSDHELSLRAVVQAMAAGLIEPILVGDRARTEALLAEIGAPDGPIEYIDAHAAADVVRLSIERIHAGADVLAKGSIDTAALMSAVLHRDSGLRTARRLTHAFYLTAAGWTRALTISDAALNVTPDLDTKRDIAINAVHLVQAIGIRRPKVAILSGTEKATDKMPSSMEAARLAQTLVEDTELDCDVAGPLAMDLAISPDAGRVKGLKGPVVGNADIVIVPTLEAGNILYKTLVYACGATAAGVVMGATVPIVLTSRADPPSARLTSFALASCVTETNR